MTSGIFSVTEDNNFLDQLGKHPEKTWTPQEIIHYAYKNKPYFSPGKGWHYSDTNYYILEILIETVTKHSFDEEINKRILKKYALNNTHYLPYKYSEKIMKQMAHGYAYAEGGFSPPMRSGSDTTLANMSAASAAGALVSTSIDVTRWVRLLFTGKVLPEQQLNEMLDAVCTGNEGSCQAGKPISAKSHSQGFSLGLERMYDRELGLMWIYIGGTYGYYSAFIWLPEKKISLALTMNATTKVSKKLLKTLARVAKLIPK
jgi:D-alanyl-D-alanine carboxypeptidase